jgi:hypothetical protein
MTDILQRYGIKEVADVTFYELDNAGLPAKPVLVLDSLKVTSIEQTAESSEARGGKGNAKLIVWDFGKELTITIEDALFSPKSLSIMMADGRVKNETNVTVKKSARVIATTAGDINTPPEITLDGQILAQKKYKNTSGTSGIELDDTDTKGEVAVKWYKAEDDQIGLTEVAPSRIADSVFEAGEVYLATWEHPVKQASTITIKPDSFPGTYYVTGDTMVRSDVSGKDEYFQFIIYKAKMQAEQTISMEAEGDPSTFNMTLQVLRAANGKMIDFVKYEFYNDNDDKTDNNSTSGDGWLTPEKKN